MKAVLFDLDGTLTDPREGITRSIAHALERMGLQPPPLDALTFAIGPPLRASFARLIGRDDAVTVEQAIRFYRERFADVGLFENEPYEGIAEVLAGVRASGAAMIVCTSKPLVYARRIVEHFGLHVHFDAIHGCELDGTREDKRDLMEYLLPRHGIAPAEAAMVGDRGADMRAARHHGVRAIGALWGYGTAEELLEHGAQALCATPGELAAFLGGLGLEPAPRQVREVPW
ncbi:MAG TPA: HAD hydrolase-like protein [Usitatibacter sp.]|nr:HAD hydrolase-like protein [Usitatibacter sp.]